MTPFHPMNHVNSVRCATDSQVDVQYLSWAASLTPCVRLSLLGVEEGGKRLNISPISTTAKSHEVLNRS